MLLTVGPLPGASQHSRIEVAPYEYRLETRAEGLQRYRTIARAIAEASQGSRQLARILVTIAVHESSLRRDIHSCAKLGDQGQSYGPTQIKYGRGSARGRSVCGIGYGPTLRAFRASARRVGRLNGSLCSRGPNCVDAFVRYSGLLWEVATTDPRYANRIAVRGKTWAATAAPRPLPRWATIGE